ncbi:myocardin-related transcription factor B isoform X3 [Homo sapiens]|uniref:myocardin-related transcription factor B isoform 4 n=1 Tax=Homo sapiens TaxID=9606 RepID=UPI000387DB5E|nr:myocardin-related transcription factor B isoform 4 [Homo sapiens]XP_047290354.1 myocardin-related transcription factor B isoform X3 [Homo sapiens]XP_047290355.1 myocardin-related transcription factor B isoform X3 [Homo sapiens]XP_047290356.1 myocardin-related transcription factor B isoform X3 [Homo sapiens]XP_047290357.1 myocardin-related transcription factor B isoform X3 [Homo sapiens]XP_054169523.1 myocardin-related transcription factor B isoform X3 [Homo sapiens]XP_054169524.1 myocardin|eukprot:XP_006720976.1 MKL/myocardin-like protein 2 isoform X5 [Homo sapiens]
MDHTGAIDTEDEVGPLAHLAPSPQSEAVAHEFQELSLQSSQNLPPLNERKNVLQLRLQQRRTREQLVDQGIMPPLKSPAAFHEQIKSLERARTENFLKHKIRSRPDRSELVRMHILEETFAEPSLQATQMKLKRARLADDLNEKIAQRPGPMELVEKNILPVDSSVKEAIIGVGKEDYPHTQGDFSFDEDSSDALSPDQPASQESQGSAASPSEPKVSESPSPVTTNTPAQFASVSPTVPEFLKTPPTADQPPPRPAAPVLPTNTVSSAKPGPALVKQSHPKNPNDKHRSKKCKDPKPRVKKLKYHQYIPPDQKGEKNEPQMDSNYARLLQQQQLFLQLQILSQQKQHYNYQTILPAPFKPLNDKNSNSGNSALNNATPNTPRQNTSTPVRKPGPLPSSLDDLKVSELKTELKLRGLPVSGTKPDLIERLKPYQEVNSSGLAAGGIVAVSSSAIVTSNPEVTVALPVTTLHNTVTSSVSTLKAELPPTGTSNATRVENVHSPLPISPSPSEQSSLSTDDTNMADTFTEIMTMMSPSQFLSSSPLRMTNNEDSLSPTSSTLSNLELDAAEKDRKLQEKEKQIEELKRKLEQEQKLVEVLKMQLEVEKRGQQQRPLEAQPSAPGHSVKSDQKHGSLGSSIKDEASLPDCSSSRQPIPVASHAVGQPVSTGGQTLVAKKAVVIKQEVPVGQAEQQSVVSQFYVSSQGQPPPAVVAQPQALLTTQTAQLLLPVSIQGSSVTSVQLPVGSLKLQTSPQAGMQTQPQIATAAQIPTAALASGLAPTVPQTQDTFPQHVLSQPQQVRKVFTNSASSNTVLPYQRHPAPAVQQPFINKASNSVLQSRNAPLPSLQNGPNTPNKISNAHSQQMDDLFDILIKSGEISLPIKEEPSPISKMRPVTASITTMPVNTVVSRPPPQVQMAPPVSLEPMGSLSASLENQLEAFLDGTLPSANEIPPLQSSSEDREPFSLIEDLQNDLLSHSGMLDHSHSPMETSETQFAAGTPCLSLDLSDSNLDNMEWLDITMPNSSSGLTPLSTTAPSMFSADFLDPQDLPLPWD